jgi:hypothetical protein
MVMDSDASPEVFIKHCENPPAPPLPPVLYVDDPPPAPHIEMRIWDAPLGMVKVWLVLYTLYVMQFPGPAAALYFPAVHARHVPAVTLSSVPAGHPPNTHVLAPAEEL